MVKWATKIWNTCSATFLQKELNGDVRHSTTRVQTCLATNQVVAAGYKKLLQNVLLFQQNLNMLHILPAQGKLVLEQVT